MRVGITGASGFIGRHLVDHLLARGYTVKVITRSEAASFERSDRLEREKIRDLVDMRPHDWRIATDDIDVVVHLAGLAHVPDRSRQRSRDAFFSINSEATKNLATALATAGARKRLIFVSSVAACRSTSEEILTDRTECRPDNDYGASKLLAEDSIKELMAQSESDYCILRPTLVYGPDSPGNLQRFATLIDKKLPLPFGSIKNRRSFAYVGNLTHVIERCIASTAATRRMFFVADRDVISTVDLLRHLADIKGVRLKLIPAPEWCLRSLGRLGDVLEAVSRIDLGINTHSIRRIAGSLYVDLDPLIEVLGQLPYAAEEGLRLTFGQSQSHFPIAQSDGD